jgi:hypothetical protein
MEVIKSLPQATVEVNGEGLIVVPDMLSLMDAINLANSMSARIIKNELYNAKNALKTDIEVQKDPKIFLRNGEHKLSESITLHPLVSIVGESETLTTLVIIDVAINMFPTSSVKNLTISGNSEIFTIGSLVYPNTPEYRKFADWVANPKNHKPCSGEFNDGIFNQLSYMDSVEGYIPKEGCRAIELSALTIKGSLEIHPKYNP